ncbi:MAG TPA: ribosome maturation factor RimM [Polyangiaceae bacterium]|nr:ribosome maturation factor RimM [Polyangiaceae bacterium]
MTEPKAGEVLSIGRVARAHGLKGELRVELYFDGSDALEHVDRVWLSERADSPAGAAAYVVDWARAVPKAYLLKLEGIDERNGAESLRGRSVWVARAELPETNAQEYYLVDLIGAKVTGPEGVIGTVVEIATHPSVDSLVIRTTDGRTLEQPLVPDWISRVSVTEKLVELSTLEGLIG